MRSHRLAAALIAALIGYSTGTPAFAATPVAEATGTLTGLSYRLIDLDETDGITPWIQFNPTSVLAMAAGQYKDGDLTGLNIITLPGGVFSATDNFLSSPDGSAFASYSASQQIVGVKAFVDDFQNGKAFQSSAGAANFYGTGIDDEFGLPQPLDNEYGFTLSANTALVIEANAEILSRINASLLQGTSFEQSLIDQNSNARLYAETYVEFGASYERPYPGEDYMVTVGDTVSLTTWPLVDLILGEMWSDIEDAQSQFLQATISNDSITEVSGSFTFGFSAAINTEIYATPEPQPEPEPEPEPWVPPIDPGPITPVPAIPEPSTYALMLLGLAGVGAAARRQRRIVATH